MRLPDGCRLYTSPCGNRTKWPSGKRTPLYTVYPWLLQRQLFDFRFRPQTENGLFFLNRNLKTFEPEVGKYLIVLRVIYSFLDFFNPATKIIFSGIDFQFRCFQLPVSENSPFPVNRSRRSCRAKHKMQRILPICIKIYDYPYTNFRVAKNVTTVAEKRQVVSSVHWRRNVKMSIFKKSKKFLLNTLPDGKIKNLKIKLKQLPRPLSASN